MHTSTTLTQPTAAALPPALTRLLVKEGVSLGCLSFEERLMALGWVWAGLPAGLVATEAAVNVALKAQLAGPARFLDVDHVELRRWLVDGGWLQRDGYGREYRRVLPCLPEAAAVAAQLQAVDTAASAAALRATREAERASRRAHWQQQAAARPQDGAPA